MKLIPEEPHSRYYIQSFSSGCVTVSGQKFTRSIIVLPDQLVPDWRPQSLKDIRSEDFELFLSLLPDLLLLGTGISHQFVDPGMFRQLYQKRIAVECMESRAACRTFTALAAEGRNVAVALLL